MAATDTEEDEQTELEKAIAQQQAEAELDKEDTEDSEDSGASSPEAEQIPAQGNKRKQPNYVLTPVTQPASVPLDTKTDEQVVAPPAAAPALVPLDTKTDEQVVAPPQPRTGTTGFDVADPDPDYPDYKTPLSDSEEKQFRSWVKKNNVPFDDSDSSDYDMRGFWKAAQEGDPDASTAVSKFDGRIHFNDRFKTPFHKTFSNESQYATSDAPHWEDDVLVDKNGNTVADETPGKAPDALNQVERATLVKLPAPDLGERGAPIPPKGELVDPDPDELYTGDQAPEVRRAAVVGTTPKAGAVTPPEVPAPTTARAKVTGGEGFWGGDLTQGTPGGPSADGTEDRPYWPKADKDIALLPAGTNYIDPHDQSQKVTPGTPKAQAVTPPAATPTTPATPTAPKPRFSQFGYTQEEYDQLQRGEQPGAKAGPATTAPQELPSLNPNGSAPPPIVMAPNGQDPVAIVFHHTSGGGGPDGVRSTLEERGLGVQLIVDPQGNIVQGGGDGRSQTKSGDGPYGKPAGRGLSNSNTIGVEFIAQDNAHITDAQKIAAQRIAAMYPNANIVGHGEINSDKEEDEGQATKAAALAYRGGHPMVAGAAAAPGGNYISGKATTFGYHDPEDEGVGARKLGGLDTNNTDLIGVAVPQSALDRFVGQHPATWRTARVEIVTKDGKHLLVPIVDLGPRDTSDARGVVADFTQGLTNLTKNTGEENYQFRIIPNAGVDVMKNPQAFADEQAAIKAGVDMTSRFAPKAAKKPNFILTPQSPAESASQDTATNFAVQGQKDTLSQLADATPNLGALIKTLSKPVDGVSDTMRQQFLTQVKDEATKYAQDYYKEPDAQKAYTKITSDADLGTATGEVLSKVLPNFGKADVSIAKFMDSADEKRVSQFVDALHPEASMDAKAQFIKQLKEAAPEDRGPLINSLISHTDETTAQAIGDPGNVLDSLNRITDQKYQANRAAAITQKQNWVANSLRTDPRLVGTPAEFITQQLAALPKNTVEAMLPPGARETAFYAEMYEDAKDNFRRDHPEYSEEELDAKANQSATAQMIPQEILGAVMGGKLGALTASISNPVKRIAASALLHTGVGATAGAVQQGAANVVAGKPILEGVPGAMAGGAIQSVPSGIMGGFHGRPRIATEEARVRVEPPPEPPVEPAQSEPTVGPLGGEKTGPRDATLEEQQPPPTPPEPAVQHEEVAPAIDHEAALNKQAEDIYNQNQSDLKGEPQADLVDAIRSEQLRREISEPGIGSKEEPQPNIDLRSDEIPVGREPPVSGQDVPTQLGRVRGTLDTKLSPEESQAFEPNREALRNAQPGTPEFTQAFRALREKVIDRFKPILDALNVRRLPDDHIGRDGSTHAFAAGRGDDDVLELHSHLVEGAKDTANIMAQGADPVENLHSTMQEEVTHFAQQEAVKDEWNSKGGYKGTGQSLNEYEIRRNAGLIQEAIKARDAFWAKNDHKNGNLIDDGLTDSIRLYNSQKFPTKEAARAHLDSILDDPSWHGLGQLHGTAAEIVRQLSQIGAEQPLTESYFKKWWKAAGDYYRQALDGLTKLCKKLGPRSALGKLELGKMVRMVEAKIKAIDKIVADEKLTPVDKQSLAGAEDPKLESYRQEADEDLRDAVRHNKDPLAGQVLREREQQRQAHIAEVTGEANRPEGKEHLLQAIVKQGGLPHPSRLKALADRGEKATGEMARVYDAWKGLSLDEKKQLRDEGVTYNKLFTRQGEGLDTFRDNLSQHPDGYNYGTVGELLSETERALSQAKKGKRVYAQEAIGAPKVPRSQREEGDFELEMQRARAARKLKPAVRRDTPMEFKWDSPEGFRLEQETTGSGIKPPPKPPPTPDTTGDLFGKPRAPGSGRSALQIIKDKLKSGARWYGQTFKGGESAMLDHKETQPLALGLRRQPSYEQQFGQRAQVVQLKEAFDAVNAKDRPRVVKEFTDWILAEQNKQPLPALSADTKKIIDSGKYMLGQTGRISKDLDVHVVTSDRKIRPMQLIGEGYYPRMFSENTRDVFNHRDDTRAKEFNDLVNRQIARGVVKSRDEFIDKFTNAITPDATSNGHFANIEKARETQLPLDFYDFSPEALIKYAEKSMDTLSKIAAFGQKLSPKGKNLFDHTVEQVQKSGTLSYNDKQAIITRIGQEQKAVYQEREKSNLGKISSLGRSVASGLFLGNPITSAYNLIGGAGQNLTFGGIGPFLKTAAHFATIKGALESLKDARERNILKSNLRDVLHDYDLVSNQGWATKGVQGFTSNMLKWGGQHLTESINRAFAMQQGKYILDRFARLHGQDNAPARSLDAMIQRRGIHDLASLARERGQGPLTDEFLRQYVMDVHGSYGPAQSASHIFDNPAGKVLLQFQKWGANTQRMATREFLMPLAKAARDRNAADFSYHLMRNLGYLAAAVGTGGVSQVVSNFLQGKDPRKPSMGEIYKRFAHGDNAVALNWAIQRAWDMITLSGFAGTMGNYSDIASQLTGADPGGRVKDPLHPPLVSVFQPFQELLQAWHGEGGQAPSPRALDQFANQISSAYRTGKRMLLSGANAAGLKLKPGEEMAAQTNLSFLRSRVKMYEAENPEIQAKQALKGSQSMSFAGRSEFDPYKDRIQGALLTGHPEDANLAVADWLDRFPPGEQKARLKMIQQSIQDSSPIKPGGSTKLDAEMQFLAWAKENLPAEEARKIFASAQTYAKTAIDTDLMGKAGTLRAIAKTNYDTFAVKTPKAVAKVTVVRPNEPTLAQHIRQAMAARALQAH